MADDISALTQAVNAARQQTNTALGQLTPRNARRVVDRLRPEREATHRLVAVMDERLVRTLDLIRKQTEIITSLERQLGQMEAWDRGQVELIRSLFGLLDAHGIDHPPLPKLFEVEAMH